MADLARQARTAILWLLPAGGNPFDWDSWVRNHFQYRGEVEEVVRTPQRMFDDLERLGYFEGDCDDISTLNAAVLFTMGFPVRFVAIRYDGSPEFLHVFVEFLYRGQWQRMDPTVPPGTIHQEDERMEIYV
jgi:hypothetical protein